MLHQSLKSNSWVTQHSLVLCVLSVLTITLLGGVISCESEQTAGEMIAGEMIAGEMNAGEMNAGKMNAGEMIAGEMPAGEMNAGELPAGEMPAGELPAGEMNIAEMPAGEMMIEYAEPTLTIRALNPLNGSGVEGMTAELTTSQVMDEASRVGVSTSMTGTDGVAHLGAQFNTMYEVILTSDQHVPHHIIGDLGDDAAEQVTFVSTSSLTNQVFSLLRLTPDSNKGIVVVGLDLPNLAPAVGAIAELSQSYESAFVFGTATPITGQTILSGGGGFVSFANVTPGETQITVTPPEGSRCAVFPAEQREEPTIQVYPGEVTVLAFICRSE